MTDPCCRPDALCPDHPQPRHHAPVTATDVTAAVLGPAVLAWTWWASILHAVIFETTGGQP